MTTVQHWHISVGDVKQLIYFRIKLDSKLDIFHRRPSEELIQCCNAHFDLANRKHCLVLNLTGFGIRITDSNEEINILGRLSLLEYIFI